MYHCSTVYHVRFPPSTTGPCQVVTFSLYFDSRLVKAAIKLSTKHDKNPQTPPNEKTLFLIKRKYAKACNLVSPTPNYCLNSQEICASDV